MMTTFEIANRLKELCSKGEYETAQLQLFADNVVSIEPMESEFFEKETTGLQNIIEKGHKFEKIVQEMHATAISEPLVTGNIIAFTLTIDVTMKGQPRQTIGELCVYHVKDGKIIKEEFFM